MICRIATRFHLVPKSMVWKIKFKRLLYGRLEQIADEQTVCEEECIEPEPIDATGPVPDYKVIFAVGRRAA